MSEKEKSPPSMGRCMDKAENEAKRHKEHQSVRLTEALVSLPGQFTTRTEAVLWTHGPVQEVIQ